MELLEKLKSITLAVSAAGNYELYQQLQEISQQTYELTIENLQLKEDIRKLQDKQKNEETRIYKNGVYYFGEDGPFCTKCYDDEEKKIRMCEEDNNIGTIYNVCPKCKLSVKFKNYEFHHPFLSSDVFTY